MVDPERLDTRIRLARVTRPDFGRGDWVRRYPNDELPMPDRIFSGRIESGERSWSMLGIEALGLDSLRELKSAHDWPLDDLWQDGRSSLVPRKTLAHAAVTVLRPDNDRAERCGACIRWAVFLPLDDAPNPRSSAVVEVVGSAAGAAVWEIVLHGYFWPSHDRQSIPGVTDHDVGTGDNAVRTRWNRAVRDELLLPLLPSALAQAVDGISEEAARHLLDAVVAAQTIKAHLPEVTRQHALLPVITYGLNDGASKHLRRRCGKRWTRRGQRSTAWPP